LELILDREPEIFDSGNQKSIFPEKKCFLRPALKKWPAVSGVAQQIKNILVTPFVDNVA